MILRAPTVRTNEYTHTSVAVNSGLIVSLIHTFATENCLNACTCMGEEEEKPLLFCFPNNLFVTFHFMRYARRRACFSTAKQQQMLFFFYCQRPSLVILLYEYLKYQCYSSNELLTLNAITNKMLANIRCYKHYRNISIEIYRQLNLN